MLRMPELKKDPSRNIVSYHFTMRGMKAPQKPQCFRNLRRTLRSVLPMGEHGERSSDPHCRQRRWPWPWACSGRQIGSDKSMVQTNRWFIQIDGSEGSGASTTCPVPRLHFTLRISTHAPINHLWPWFGFSGLVTRRLLEITGYSFWHWEFRGIG